MRFYSYHHTNVASNGCIWRLRRATVLARVILVVLATCISQPQAVAEALALSNGLNKSADLVLGVHQFCRTREETEKLFKSLGLESWRRLGENFGSVSVYGVTSHIYSISESKSGTVGLYISYETPLRGSNCAALILLDGTAGNVRIRPGISMSNYEEALSSPAREELARFKAECKSLGASALPRNHHGDFVLLDDGSSVRDPLRFNCDAAVPNNISSILTKIGKSEFRIMAIHNHLFLEERKP